MIRGNALFAQDVDNVDARTASYSQKQLELERRTRQYLALNDTDENTCNLRPYLRAGLTDNLSLDASYTYSQIDNRIDGVTRERSLAQLKLVWDYPVVE